MFTLFTWLFALMPDPILAVSDAIWITAINGGVVVIVAGATFWTQRMLAAVTRQSATVLEATQNMERVTIKIEHSVNADRDRMIAKGESLELKIAALEKSISRLLVERAKGAESAATMDELQSEEPLPEQAGRSPERSDELK